MKPTLKTFRSFRLATRGAAIFLVSFTHAIATPITGDTVTGNLTVTGAEGEGNVAALGWGLFQHGIDIGTNGEALLNWSGNSTAGTAMYDIKPTTGSYLWRDSLSTTVTNKMLLDDTNTLTLYKQNGTTVGITLDPINERINFANTGSGIYRAGSPLLTIGSNGKLVANSLTLTDYTALSKGLLNGYSNNGALSVSMSNGVTDANSATAMSESLASGEGSTAMSYSHASGGASTAMSYGYASAWSSVAMSSGQATEDSSTAMSYGTASGAYSTAMSNGAASGESSTAMSGGNASGNYAIAMSTYSNAYGDSSAAMSSGETYGDFSTAMSSGMASGISSTAMSNATTAGISSTAMSQGDASGDYSTAMSGGSAFGKYSLAAGQNASASSFCSTSLGRYNEGNGNASSWIENEPLLLVGNGIDMSHKSNAIATLKNGHTTLTNKAWKDRVAADPTQALADPSTSTATDSDGEALLVEGHTRLRGKVVIETPQGDIPMFTGY